MNENQQHFGKKDKKSIVMIKDIIFNLMNFENIRFPEYKLSP